jgi:serralysin
LSQVAANFVASPEFAAKYGSLDDAQFVTLLYENALHREPDVAGLAFHVANLEGGMSRADVLVAFSESPENQAALIGAMIMGGILLDPEPLDTPGK